MRREKVHPLMDRVGSSSLGLSVSPFASLQQTFRKRLCLIISEGSVSISVPVVSSTQLYKERIALVCQRSDLHRNHSL